jgi:hypothetical protein
MRQPKVAVTSAAAQALKDHGALAESLEDLQAMCDFNEARRLY